MEIAFIPLRYFVTSIAGRLVVSPSTIKTHVSHILSKLGVASRTEAVALALRHKLIA